MPQARIIGRGIMWLLPRRRDSLSGIMMRVAVTMGLAAAAVRRFRLLPVWTLHCHSSTSIAKWIYYKLED